MSSVTSSSSYDPSFIAARQIAPTRRAASAFLKRQFDVVASLLVIIGLAPVFAAMIILVSLDGGPAFYTQKRVGRNGRTFGCFKFRTMVVDADEELKRLLAADETLRAEYQTYWKLKDDPRVTRIGKFLRRYSLDELPQVINVLRGDMSLVGPRPRSLNEMRFFESSMPESNEGYVTVRPGLTGLWQISGRNALSLETKGQLDALYAENWSFRKDLAIIVATVPVVLKGEGAF
jgi:lipopolysaccharide/colanic/teichoic acid biosynthesis glycosyltransferase